MNEIDKAIKDKLHLETTFDQFEDTLCIKIFWGTVLLTESRVYLGSIAFTNHRDR